MCHTFFKRTTLCEFVAVAQKMATRNRKVRCLPHEFHAMQATACARWAAQVSLILTDKKDHCHLAWDGECPALL